MRFELEPYWDNIRPYPLYHFLACYLTLSEWNEIIKNFEEYRKGVAPRITNVVEIEKLGKINDDVYKELVEFFVNRGTYIEIFHEKNEEIFIESEGE